MRRIVVTMAFLCLSAYQLTGQHLSPLFGVLAAHSPLQRPQLFQELQDSLPDYLQSIEPGLRMPFLDEKFRKFESEVWKTLNGVTIENSGETVNIKYNSKNVITLTWSDAGITANVSGVETSLSGVDLKLLLWRLVNHINNPIIKQFASVIRDSESNDVNVLLRKLFQKIDSKIIPEFSTAKKASEYLNTIKTNLTEQIIQALHIAQSEFNEVVAQASNHLILNGNIGLSLTNGEGAFAGGVLFGAKWKHWGVAGFTNLIGSSIEGENKPGISQSGFRGYFTCNDFEVNVLLSGYAGFDDSTRKDFQSFEGGLGMSLRFGEKLTIGLAVTTLFLQYIPEAYNLGILLNGVSQYLPTFVIGAGYQKVANGYHAYPIFQIIQPIKAL